MPAYVVHMVTDALNDRERAVRNSRILALGVAYKPNVSDVRDSPALEIIEALMARGARVDYHDPLVSVVALNGTPVESVPWSATDLAAYDAVLVLTAHAGYDWSDVARRARLVIDTRNATADLGPLANVIRL
jgi:UDP-N-acetyl-D-glucosamine dehydrogenase